MSSRHLLAIVAWQTRAGRIGASGRRPLMWQKSKVTSFPPQAVVVQLDRVSRELDVPIYISASHPLSSSATTSFLLLLTN